MNYLSSISGSGQQGILSLHLAVSEAGGWSDNTLNPTGPTEKEVLTVALEQLKLHCPNESIRTLENMADHGSSVASYLLGMIYLKGYKYKSKENLGIKADISKALHYLNKEPQLPQANSLLGIVYYTDRFGMKDLDKAENYLLKYLEYPHQNHLSAGSKNTVHILLGLIHLEKKDLPLEKIFQDYMQVEVNSQSILTGDESIDKRIRSLYNFNRATYLHQALQKEPLNKLLNKSPSEANATQYNDPVYKNYLRLIESETDLSEEDMQALPFNVANDLFIAGIYQYQQLSKKEPWLATSNEKWDLKLEGAKKMWERNIEKKVDSISNLCNLGRAYFAGKGVFKTRDHYKKAFECWQKAYQLSAENPDPRVLYLLGLAYCSGKGVQKDLLKGKAFLEQASGKGLIAANTALDYLDHPNTKIFNKRDLKQENGPVLDPDKDLNIPNKELEEAVKTNKSWFKQFIIYPLTQSSSFWSSAKVITTLSLTAIAAVVGTLAILTIAFPHVMIPIFIVSGIILVITLIALGVLGMAFAAGSRGHY